MKLKLTLIVAIIITIITTIFWESYWRSQGFTQTLDDNEALWSVQRERVENATSDNMLIMGSSRVLFDIQLNEWETQTGIRPIQLATVGSSPLPIFHDIVNNTKFNGTILVGATPGLFFSTTNPEAQPWAWPQAKVDYFHNRTYAQQLNHLLSIPLQKSLVFMSDHQGVDGIKLKELINKIHVGNRVLDPMPPFHEFGEIEMDRNLKMKPITVTDTAYANSVIKVWQFFMEGAKNGPPPDKDATMAFFLKDLNTFKARGGNVLLLRCPSSGSVRMGEKMGLPRTDFWDDLVKQAKVPAYHFEDYDQFKNLTCPEESHLSHKDARFFTTELAKIMIKDKAITNKKTN